MTAACRRLKHPPAVGLWAVHRPPLMGTADEYDLHIVGGGLAGLTAGLYAARIGLRTLIS